MAVRIRKDGRIVCAAMYEAEDNDIYIDDNLHYYLSTIEKVLVTTKMEIHKTDGIWWWKSKVPNGVLIDEWYYT